MKINTLGHFRRRELIFAHREFEKVRSKTNIISLIPLYYSLGPAEKAAKKNTDQNAKEATRILCDEIRVFLAKLNYDQGGHLQSRLCRIQRLVDSSFRKTSQSLNLESAAPQS